MSLSGINEMKYKYFFFILFTLLQAMLRLKTGKLLNCRLNQKDPKIKQPDTWTNKKDDNYIPYFCN